MRASKFPVTLESFHQRTTKVTLRIVGLDASWFDHRHERDLQLPPTGKIKEFFECHIPSELAQAESKRYHFSIEAIALDSPVVKVDGILTLLPQGYIDFSCGELYSQDTGKQNWLPFRNKTIEQRCVIQFDNQSNLIQDVNVEVDRENNSDTSDRDSHLNLRLKKLKFWQRSTHIKDSLTSKILPQQGTLNLKEPTNFELILQQLRPWFGFPQKRILQVKAIISDDRVEVHNETQTLKIVTLPVIPSWLQFLLLFFLFLSGYFFANWFILYKKQHTAAVNSVSFDGLGQEVISASNDQTIRYWKVENNQIQPQGILDYSNKALRVIRYRPVNNDRIAIGYENGEIQLFNLLSGKSFLPLVDNNQKDDRVFDLAFTKDSRYLFSGHGSGIVRQWNISNRVALNKRIQQQQQVGFAVNSLTLVGENETHLAVGGRYNQLTLWNLKTNQLKSFTNNIGGQEDYVLSLAKVDNKPNILVTSNNQGQIKIWNLSPCITGSEQCELLDEWKTGTQAIRSVAFSPDGCYLASAGDDGNARLWFLNYLGKRVKEQDTIGKILHKSSQPLKSIDIIRIRDEVLVVSGGKDKRVRLYRERVSNPQCN